MRIADWEPTLGIERVIVVVLDGLRPDALWLYDLPHLSRLSTQGLFTPFARTVSPSVTAAAMTSLFTGVAPDVHGIQNDRFGLPRDAASLQPLPLELLRHGLPTSTFLAELPRAYRGLAQRMAGRAGVRSASFRGNGALEILACARETLSTQRHGLIVLHLPDADRAGHEHGWLSRPYAQAAFRLDAALGLLVAETRVEHDPSTLMIALADHGGGGVDPKEHDSAHVHDRTIPLLLLGGRVAPRRLERSASLLDVPATVLWSLGVPVPSSYAGTPLQEALEPAPIEGMFIGR